LFVFLKYLCNTHTHTHRSEDKPTHPLLVFFAAKEHFFSFYRFLFEIPHFAIATLPMTIMAESLLMIAQRNTLGIEECTATPFALKGQYIYFQRYAALSGRIFPTRLPTQRDTLGYRIFGFQPSEKSRTTSK